MNKESIIRAIENKVQKYLDWTVGITDNPERRKDEHNNPKDWIHWWADSESIARDVEKHFLDKGMKGSSGGGNNPNYVYIF